MSTVQKLLVCAAVISSTLGASQPDQPDYKSHRPPPLSIPSSEECQDGAPTPPTVPMQLSPCVPIATAEQSDRNRREGCCHRCGDLLCGTCLGFLSSSALLAMVELLTGKHQSHFYDREILATGMTFGAIAGAKRMNMLAKKVSLKYLKVD